MIDRIRAAALLRILYLTHAIRQMSRPDRLIRASEVRNVIYSGEVIEDYPDDSRGHSCLLLGEGEGNRRIHVVCAPKADYLAIITAYLPSDDEWDTSCKQRKPK